MKEMFKSTKGITLIALIITIIVMLILVGVTVSVALNGGLIGRAKNAAAGMSKAAAHETVISEAIGAIGNDGKVDFAKLKERINGIDGLEYDEESQTVKYLEDGTVWSISDDGTVGNPKWKLRLEQQYKDQSEGNWVSEGGIGINEDGMTGYVEFNDNNTYRVVLVDGERKHEFYWNLFATRRYYFTSINLEWKCIYR